MITNLHRRLLRFLAYIVRSCLYEFLPAQKKMSLVFSESNVQMQYRVLKGYILPFLDIRSSFIIKNLAVLKRDSLSAFDVGRLLLQHPSLRGFFIGATSVGLGALMIKIV